MFQGDGIKLGYTGTRRGMTKAQLRAVARIFTMFYDGVDIMEVHSGDCLGGDEDFHSMATVRGIQTVGHPPINERYRAFCEYTIERKPKDYLPRDDDIVEESHLMIATPGEPYEVWRGSGTWYTVRRATGYRPLHLIFPDGEVEFREVWHNGNQGYGHSRSRRSRGSAASINRRR